MRSFQGVVKAANFCTLTHTHLKLQHDSMLLCPVPLTLAPNLLLLHLLNHRLTPNTVSSETWTQQSTSSADSHTCSIISLRGHRTFTLPFVVSSTLFFPSLCFWTIFLIFPLRWSLSCHCYLRPLLHGSWGSWGEEYRDESRLWKQRGHCLSLFCATSLSFTRSYSHPSIPSPKWSPITPLKNDQLIPPLITGLTAELTEKHPNLWDFLVRTSVRWSTPMGRLPRLSLLYLHSWYQQAAMRSWGNWSFVLLSYVTANTMITVSISSNIHQKQTWAFISHSQAGRNLQAPKFRPDVKSGKH